MKPLLPILCGSLLILGAQLTPKPATPTFSKDIKPLIDSKCLSCHVSGGSAPFPLTTFAQVHKRAELIERMMLTRAMPPCYATSDFGDFCEAGGPITDEQGVTLQRWVAAGSPEGEPSKPANVRGEKTWRMGRPDAVLRPRWPVTIPEEGNPYWRALVLPLSGFKGRQLRAFDVRPDEPQSVRQVVLAIGRLGLKGTRRELDGWDTAGSLNQEAAKYVGTWAPGYSAWKLPHGVSMKLDGDLLVAQVQCLPRGRALSGGIEVALYFSENNSDTEPQWTTLQKEDFHIPAPGSLSLAPEGELPPHCEVLAVYPEARFFCSSIKLWAGDKLLFKTRLWQPYWGGSYLFSEPVPFPNGAKLRAEFEYDNEVHMGQTEGTSPTPIKGGPHLNEEMCRMHVLYVRR